MKTILVNILAVAAIALAATSCESFLDSKAPSAFDTSTVYSNYSLTESTIFSISQSFGETNSYRGRYLSWAGINSDIEWYNTFKTTDEKYHTKASRGRTSASRAYASTAIPRRTPTWHTSSARR